MTALTGMDTNRMTNYLKFFSVRIFHTHFKWEIFFLIETIGAHALVTTLLNVPLNPCRCVQLAYNLVG